MVLSTLDALAYTPLVALGLLAKMKSETHAAYAAMAAVVITTDFIDTADVAAVTTALGATFVGATYESQILRIDSGVNGIYKIVNNPLTSKAKVL